MQRLLGKLARLVSALGQVAHDDDLTLETYRAIEFPRRSPRRELAEVIASVEDEGSLLR